MKMRTRARGLLGFALAAMLLVAFAAWLTRSGVLLTSPIEGVNSLGVMWPFLQTPVRGFSEWDSSLFFGIPTAEGDIWLSKLNLWTNLFRLLGPSPFTFNTLQLAKISLMGALFFQVLRRMLGVRHDVACVSAVAYCLLPAHLETTFEPVSGFLIISLSCLVLLWHRFQSNLLSLPQWWLASTLIAGANFYTGNGANNMALLLVNCGLMFCAVLPRAGAKRALLWSGAAGLVAVIVAAPIFAGPLLGSVERRQGGEEFQFPMVTPNFASWLYSFFPFRFSAERGRVVWNYAEYFGIGLFSSIFAPLAISIVCFRRKDVRWRISAWLVVAYFIACTVIGYHSIAPPPGMLGSLISELFAEYPLDIVLWVMAILAAFALDSVLSGKWRLSAWVGWFSGIVAAFVCIVGIVAFGMVVNRQFGDTHDTWLQALGEGLQRIHPSRPASLTGSLGSFLANPLVAGDWLGARAPLLLAIFLGLGCAWVGFTFALKTAAPKPWMRVLVLGGVFTHAVSLLLWTEDFDRAVLPWLNRSDPLARALRSLDRTDRLATFWTWDHLNQPFCGANSRFFTAAEQLSSMHSFVPRDVRGLLAGLHGIDDPYARLRFDVCHPPSPPFTNRNLLNYCGVGYFLIPDGTNPGNVSTIASADGWTLYRNDQAEPMIAAGHDTLRITQPLEVGEGELRFSAVFESPEVVVLKYGFHKNWRLFVDGQPRHLLRENHGLMQMDLPTGTHAVRLEFQAVALKVSGAVAAIAALVIIVSLASPRLRCQSAASLFQHRQTRP